MSTPDAHAHDEVASRGMSRRDALKKAGLVGAAAVWATPAVQIAFAPAAIAASPGGGGTCTGWTDSSKGFCGGQGGCPKCQNGRTCKENTDCLSDNCNRMPGQREGVCTRSPAKAACVEDSDCTTNRCGNKVNGVGVCSEAYPGEVCVTKDDCVSGRCTDGRCAKSRRNEVCRTTDDCESGLSCANNGKGSFVCK